MLLLEACVSKKHMKTIAVLIVVVFLATIITYPLIYGTDPEPEQAPVESSVEQ